MVFNAGNNAIIDFTQLTAAQFEDFWRIGCYAGFLVGREAARRLLPLGRGTVIFTGASGSLRGKPGFAHFAAAKAGLRMITQSMAREYGPKGLHIAHVLIDGGVDGDRLRNLLPGYVEKAGSDGLLDVDAIAENYWTLHRQAALCVDPGTGSAALQGSVLSQVSKRKAARARRAAFRGLPTRLQTAISAWWFSAGEKNFACFQASIESSFGASTSSAAATGLAISREQRRMLGLLPGFGSNWRPAWYRQIPGPATRPCRWSDRASDAWFSASRWPWREGAVMTAASAAMVRSCLIDMRCTSSRTKGKDRSFG